MPNRMSDEDFDSLLVRRISQLPAREPARGFADRVMSRVALPQPGMVRLARRARSWALEPRHALRLAGAYAVSAAIGLLVAVPWLLERSFALRTAADWAVDRGASLLTGGAMLAANWLVSSGVAGVFQSIPLTGQQWLVGAGLLGVAYTGCAAGCYFLLRNPRRANAPVA